MSTGSRFVLPYQTVINDFGVPRPGALLNFYISGTSTRANTYADATLMVANTNPVVASANGQFGNIFLDPAITYKVVLTDSSAVQIWTADPVSAFGGSGGTIFGISVADYATIQLADAAATAAGEALIFPPGTWTLTNSHTFTSSALFIEGARLNVTSGQIATFVYPITASPDYRIFTGTGSVVGIRQVYPEWWGVTYGGMAGNLTAFNSAYACVAASVNSIGGRQKIIFHGKVYGLEGPWITPVGANISIHFEGAGVSLAGTRLQPNSSFSGDRLWWIRGSTDTTQQIADWVLTDIGLDMTPGFAGPTLYGLLIGSDPVAPTTGELLLGLERNLIENLWIQGFPTNLVCSAVTLLEFRRCGIWNQLQTVACLNMLLTVNNNVTADISFVECQFVAPVGVTGGNGVLLKANLHQFGFPPVINQLAGIKFDRCNFFQGDMQVQLLCANGAELTDVWFTKCQWDGTSNKMLYIESDSVPSLVQDIHVDHCYLDGSNIDTSSTAITITCIGTGGFVRNVYITNNWFAQGAGSGLILFSLLKTIHGVTFTGNQFYEYNFPAGSVVEIAGVLGGNFASNTMTQKDISTAVTQYFIDLQNSGGPSTGNDYITIIGNNGSGIPTGGCVNDASGGIQKYIAGNI